MACVVMTGNYFIVFIGHGTGGVGGRGGDAWPNSFYCPDIRLIGEQMVYNTSQVIMTIRRLSPICSSGLKFVPAGYRINLQTPCRMI
jgi:hypothetical protein